MENEEEKKEEVVTEEASQNAEQVSDPIPITSSEAPTPEVTSEPPVQVEEKKKGNKVVPILLILVVVLLIAAAVLYFTGFFGNKEEKKNDNGKDDKTVTTEKKKVSKFTIKNNDLNDFDLAFMQIENGESNIVYSPLSIKYALQMLSEGANGETKKQIDNIIGEYKYTKYVNSKHASFANAMFINTRWKDNIKSTYTKRLLDSYGAEVIMDSFESDVNMRKWVKNKTLDLIDSPIEIKDKDLSMYILINALAIDMNWNNRLQCSITDNNDVPCKMYYVSYFHEDYFDTINYIEDEEYPKMTFNGNSNTKSTEIGATINNYDIIKDLGEDNIKELLSKEYDELVEKYGKEDYEKDCPSKEEAIQEHLKTLKGHYNDVQVSTDFYMYDDDEIKMFAKDLKEYDGLNLQYVAIMPKKTSLKDYVDNITAEDVNNNIKKLKDIKAENFEDGAVINVTGNIPLFSFNSHLDLINDLKQLEIKEVFDKDNADLSGIADVPSYVETALHEAKIEFSNEGIRAGAFTEIGGGLGNAVGPCLNHTFEVPVKVIDISFNNPYLFLIRDKKTGEIWFAGKVYEAIEQK